MKLFLFDVDQTLISTGGAGVRALNRAFREILSMENVMDGILPHGKTDPGIIREIFTVHGTASGVVPPIDRILEAYLKFLREEIQVTTAYRVLPGILSILDEFSSRSDALLGLATGNVERGARIKLQRGDLNRYFSFGGFGSDSESRTALVQHAAELGAERVGSPVKNGNIFVIGDTPLDIKAGREAGFCTIGVATGNYSQAELAAAGPTFVISDFEREADQFRRATS